MSLIKVPVTIRLNGFRQCHEVRFTLLEDGQAVPYVWLNAPNAAAAQDWADSQIRRAEIREAWLSRNEAAQRVAALATPKTQPLTVVNLYTDGSNIGQPGPGGWGALLETVGRDPVELSGSLESATNNIAELMGVIQGLKALKRRCKVNVYSDSQYVVKGLNHWLPRWIARNWLNSQNEPVANRELWEELASLKRQHDVSAFWIKGHAGHPQNERVDALAKAAARAEQKRQRETGAEAPEKKNIKDEKGDL